MLILVLLLRQKPADLNLQCFQKWINSGSAGRGLTRYFFMNNLKMNTDVKI